jgi:hypothetical protein
MSIIQYVHHSDIQSQRSGTIQTKCSALVVFRFGAVVVEAYNGSSAHRSWTDKFRFLDKCSCRVNIFCGLKPNKKPFVIVVANHLNTIILAFVKGEYSIGRQGIATEKDLESSCSKGASLDSKASKFLGHEFQIC